MTHARTWSIALTGMEGALVEVEADVSNHTPDFRIIGLGDRSLSEAVQRVQNACENAALPLPRRRLTVNLSPAHLPKRGSAFDLAVAIAALACGGTIDDARIATTVHLGELGLDGAVRPVPGVLPAVLAAARAGFERVAVPRRNAAEAALVPGVEIVGVDSLASLAAHYGAEVGEVGEAGEVGEVGEGDVRKAPGGPALPVPAAGRPDEAEPAAGRPPERARGLDLSDVVGQRTAVEALLVVAAGGHHLLMTGPPGAGKTMLARRLPGLLPPLDDAAALSVASVRSLAGHAITTLDRTPPFEAPHHSASLASLVGGGSRLISPGAIARASEGVLFLDEAGEYPRAVLDALRQPLEHGTIQIARAGVSATFPARCQLVLATNPCPCGNDGVAGAECTCAPQAVRRYRARLSGPLLDRIDVRLALHRVSLGAAHGERGRLDTETARGRVLTARARAAERLRPTPWRCNAQVDGRWLREGPHAPTPAARRVLDRAFERGRLSLRAYDRVLRVAWSVLDLAGGDRLTEAEIGRALLLNQGVPT